MTVAEILDKPWPEPRETPLRLDEVPRVVAVVLGTGNKLRFSSVSRGLGTIQNLLLELGIKAPPPIESPLPLALLDAAVWLIRPPDWVDEESRQRLYRENVEDYYENRWVVSHRIGLRPEGYEFPIGVAPESLELRARLEAMIRLREELAARPSAVALYQGYPFDRLRHRLGLPPKTPAAIDPIEIGFMTGAELDALDVAALDDHALADAYRSTVPLGDNARTARFAEKLVERRADVLRWLDLPALFGCLLYSGEGDRVSHWIAEGISIDAEFQDGRNRVAFDYWLAGRLDGQGEFEQARDLYESVLERCDSEHFGIDWANRFLSYASLLIWSYDRLYSGDQARNLAEKALGIARSYDPDSAGHFEAFLNNPDR